MVWIFITRRHKSHRQHSPKNAHSNHQTLNKIVDKFSESLETI